MGENTGIGWTGIIPGVKGATWNPLRATNIDTLAEGTFCFPAGDGCMNCYANIYNLRAGTGIPYKKANQELVDIQLAASATRQVSIDWPLRKKKSTGIFLCSLTDWLGEFVPTAAATLMLSSMLLAQHHVFVTLTKRKRHLLNLFKSIDNQEVPTFSVFDEKVWTQAMVRTQGITWNRPEEGFVLVKNVQHNALIPWPPPNIYFGVSLCNSIDVDQSLIMFDQIHRMNPTTQMIVSQEPALDTIKWEETGINPQWIKWLIWGGESGQDARPASVDSALATLEFGKKYNIPVYIKQMGAVLEREMGIAKGFVPEDLRVQMFPNVTDSFYPWPK